MASEAQSEDEIPLDDDKLIEQADKEIAEERWLVAARLLRKVKDKSALTKKHTRILTKAEQVERIVPALMSEPGDEWTKQGETHGKFDTIIYYKVVDSKLTARIETPMSNLCLYLCCQCSMKLTFIPLGCLAGSVPSSWEFESARNCVKTVAAIKC